MSGRDGVTPLAGPRRGRPAGAARTRGGGAAGFTLIELVVVLAILAVATGLVLPMVGRGSETLRLRSEAGRVATVLREARLRAVSQHYPTRVTLDRSRNTVVVVGRDAVQIRELVVAPGLRLSVATGGETLTFSSRGITRETRWLLEAAGGRKLAIDVEAVTGRVRVGPERPS